MSFGLSLPLVSARQIIMIPTAHFSGNGIRLPHRNGQISYAAAHETQAEAYAEEQSRRFIDAAKEAGVDAGDKTLERNVRGIAKPRLSKTKPKLKE